ncbi:hypothetical protein [Fimbriiglobus ruber]|uniref:Glycosyl transferase, family 25 n=1 Tax=Fimbriiglobus ruber TaxID=1908690 RepID=A0A225EB27_9BACT|nr:hypothetical protein [Fimbriiglobus ruber]OWK45745.1 Glycosyl transferase, family 25 [Fimbriiglobus ruber]
MTYVDELGRALSDVELAIWTGFTAAGEPISMSGEKRERYRELWRKRAAAGNPPMHQQPLATAAPAKRRDCIHLGSILDHTDGRGTRCGCQGKWLRACDVHGTCVKADDRPNVARCDRCPDYTPDDVAEHKQPSLATEVTEKEREGENESSVAPVTHSSREAVVFDRVYLINLKQRADRLAAFRANQVEYGWKLPEPTVFEAVRGDTVGVPSYFSQGGGAWGCLRSHVTCLERALMDGVGSVLMLEDDLAWYTEAWGRLEEFLRAVPADWDQLMLGGQHMGSPAGRVAPGVVRVRNCQRTHAYAVRGGAMRSLLNLWYTCGVHIDWKMGEWQKSWKVYAPDPFVFGQAGGRSDISGRENPAKFWVAPKDIPVVHLTCPPGVVSRLRGYGLHTGHDRDEQDLDRGLADVVKHRQKGPALRKWVDTISWECASDEGSVVCVYHPMISAADVRAIHPGVIEVKGDTVEECLARLTDCKLKANYGATHVLILRAPRSVAEALPGFHGGYWTDPVTGQDNGLRAIAVAADRAPGLREWFETVARECEKTGAVPLVWHPEIRAEDVARATDRKVVEVTAASVEEAARGWKDGR